MLGRSLQRTSSCCGTRQPAAMLESLSRNFASCRPFLACTWGGSIIAFGNLGSGLPAVTC